MFKKGDVVICTESYMNQFTEGKTYIVSEVHYDGGSIHLERDDLGSTKNGWSSSKFILDTKASKLLFYKYNK